MKPISIAIELPLLMTPKDLERMPIEEAVKILEEMTIEQAINMI